MQSSKSAQSSVFPSDGHQESISTYCMIKTPDFEEDMFNSNKRYTRNEIENNCI